MPSGETRTVVLDTPVPVFIVYLTAYVAPSGEGVVIKDIYDRDGPIISALDGRHSGDHEQTGKHNAEQNSG